MLILSACAASFFLLASVADARANLRVSGYSPHALLWKRLYEQMPDVWKGRADLVVREVSDSEMDQLVADDEGDGGQGGKNDDSVVDGYYHEGRGARDETPTITLRRTMPEDEAAFVFTHEYGHYVWYKVLTRQQRNDYVSLWRILKRSGELISRYAGDSDEEGFAEAFAHFLRKPARLRNLDPRSYRFLSGIEQSVPAKNAADRRGRRT